MTNKAFAQVHWDLREKRFQVVGFNPFAADTEEELLEGLAKTLNKRSQLTLTFFTSVSDRLEYTRFIRDFHLYASDPNEWPVAGDLVQTSRPELDVFLAPKPTKQHTSWKRFARRITPTTWELLAFLTNAFMPYEVAASKGAADASDVPTASMNMRLSFHPARKGARFITKHGGDMDSMVSFLKLFKDVRPRLVRMPKWSLETGHFLTAAGLNSSSWAGAVRRKVHRVIEVVLDGKGDQLHPLTWHEHLACAILGRSSNGLSAFASRVASQFSCPTRGAEVAIEAGATLLLSTWLAKEYHSELFDDAVFIGYGFEPGFLGKFRAPGSDTGA